MVANVCRARWKVRFFLTPQRSAISFKYALVFLGLMTVLGNDTLGNVKQ